MAHWNAKGLVLGTCKNSSEQCKRWKTEEAVMSLFLQLLRMQPENCSQLPSLFQTSFRDEAPSCLCPWAACIQWLVNTVYKYLMPLPKLEHLQREFPTGQPCWCWACLQLSSILLYSLSQITCNKSPGWYIPSHCLLGSNPT